MIKTGKLIEAEALCWSCARATGKQDKPCPWVQLGKPVEGWTARPGLEYTVSDQKQGKKVRGWCVKECPLFERDAVWWKLSQVVALVQQEYNIHGATFWSRPHYWLGRYERGKERLPEWVWYELEDHLEAVEAARARGVKIGRPRKKKDGETGEETIKKSVETGISVKLEAGKE